MDFLRHDESRITWIIIALFLMGVATSFFLTVFVTGEAIEASIQEDLAMRTGLPSLCASQRKKKAVNRFYESLKVVAASNESPNIDALLEMEYATALRVSQAIEVLGNLLITLGLVGTVVGLTLTLTGLTASLDALGHDQDMLLAGLRKAMGGMGTAFYTTLLGAVLGGVLLRIFALITDNGLSALHDSIMKTCMVYLTPDFKPTVERDVRFLNVEIEALDARLNTLQSSFISSKESVKEFHEAIKELAKMGGSDDGVYTLRETLRMQKFYRLLLRQELELMHRLNRSWWMRFKEFLQTKQSHK